MAKDLVATVLDLSGKIITGANSGLGSGAAVAGADVAWRSRQGRVASRNPDRAGQLAIKALDLSPLATVAASWGNSSWLTAADRPDQQRRRHDHRNALPLPMAISNSAATIRHFANRTPVAAARHTAREGRLVEQLVPAAAPLRRPTVRGSMTAYRSWRS